MQNMSGGKTALGLDANIGAMLCYLANLIPCCLPLGLVYSIIVIIQDKSNKLTRFHAFQSLLLSVAALVIGMIFSMIFGTAMLTDSGAIFGLGGMLYTLFGLAMLAAIIFAAIKAFQGQIFKLPIIGDLADKWSN
jgi:uncharacterized membrane protein